MLFNVMRGYSPESTFNVTLGACCTTRVLDLVRFSAYREGHPLKGAKRWGRSVLSVEKRPAHASTSFRLPWEAAELTREFIAG